MKKFFLILVVALLVLAFATVGDKTVHIGLFEPNDDKGPGPYSEHDLATVREIIPLAVDAGTGQSISSEPAGFWLPPEDLLTEEEKEFRSQVIEAAGLDENSPDFDEQLTKLFTAKRSTDYPNYETYKLFINYQ